MKNLLKNINNEKPIMLINNYYYVHKSLEKFFLIHLHPPHYSSLYALELFDLLFHFFFVFFLFVI